MARLTNQFIGAHSYERDRKPQVLDLTRPAGPPGPLPLGLVDQLEGFTQLDNPTEWCNRIKEVVGHSFGNTQYTPELHVPNTPVKETQIAVGVDEFDRRTTDSAFYMLNEYIPSENTFMLGVLGHILKTGSAFADNVQIDDLHEIFRHHVSEMPVVQLEIVLRMFKHLYEEVAPYVLTHTTRITNQLYTEGVMPSNVSHREITPYHEALTAEHHGFTAVLCIRSSLVW